MWHPRTWADVQAAINVMIEGSQLDFKDAAALSSTREVSKDVAAMAVYGGVLVYGMDEVHEVAAAAPG